MILMMLEIKLPWKCFWKKIMCERNNVDCVWLCSAITKDNHKLFKLDLYETSATVRIAQPRERRRSIARRIGRSEQKSGGGG